MKADAERLDVTSDELAALVEGARTALGEPGYRKLQAAIRTLGYVTELLETRQATLDKLRRLLCHSSTERTKTVLKQAGIETGEKKRKAPGAPKSTAPGHGSNGAAAYRGARKVEVPHASLKTGDQCPDCQRGKVYLQRDPGVLVRIQGQAPIAATVYELEKLRCNLCGDVFTAAAPEEAGEEKYDETAASMIAMLRYGSGFPWKRLEGLQKNLGIPLPVATQCEIVTEIAAQIQPAGDELIRQAAQGGVMHNDDTFMRVLSLDRGAASDADIAAERDGSVHHRNHIHRRRISDRTVFHRAQACWREPGRHIEAAGGGLGSAHPDVRRAVAQSAQAAREAGNHYRALPGACPLPLCGSDAELPAGMPVRLGESG
jgi:transposase